MAREKAPTGNKSSFKLEISSMPGLTPYLPGILLFFSALIISLLTYKDYGVIWDESYQRDAGLISYNYIFNGDNYLLNFVDRQYGVGFELILVFLEKWLNLTESRDITLMRHLVTNLFFLISVFFAYVLILRLFKNKFVASLGFLMILFAPRIYAHSFFNSKDIPSLSMFIISFTMAQIAFEKNKPVLFLLLGIVCGYTTNLRIIGVMLTFFLFLFLLIDLITASASKGDKKKPVLNILLFSVGFCGALYATWPYLWGDPINRFVESFGRMSHFDLTKPVLVNGNIYSSLDVPWTYFPNWFLVTNPEIWLLAGFAGAVLISVNLLKRPLIFFKNTNERNFLLYLLCFFTPVIAVILLHSSLYDDWRHLYFVYPAFVLMGLYSINKVLRTKYKLIVQGVCVLQLALIGYFLVKYYPFGELYFNNFVSHESGYLQKNYDMDYWGASYKQGLDYVLSKDDSRTIKVNCSFQNFLDNNIRILPEEDYERIAYTGREDADYFFPYLLGGHYDDDYASIKIDSVTVLNSPVFYIIKEEKDTARQRLMRQIGIANLQKSLAADPNDADTYIRLCFVLLRNNDVDQSEIYIKQALQFDLNNYKTLDNLVRIYFSKGRFPIVIQLCNKILMIRPQYLNAYASIGAAYLRMGKLDSAKKYQALAQQK